MLLVLIISVDRNFNGTPAWLAVTFIRRGAAM
jgi:hypothetical protein